LELFASPLEIQFRDRSLLKNNDINKYFQAECAGSRLLSGGSARLHIDNGYGRPIDAEAALRVFGRIAAERGIARETDA
jgi:hypothetical protein